ncbi:MAG TPA: hydrogenase/urease maturation nickel metallochaperone HypA [Bauldia sp.]|nr:hydrogenase/urease maturation nickel metallochaperone HypA [Bauldia sp.]
MHDRALMADLMRRILAAAAHENARAITGVSVRLGALSHMTPDHFREHFEEAAAGTIAADARITAVQSADIRDPRAEGVWLEGIEVET